MPTPTEPRTIPAGSPVDAYTPGSNRSGKAHYLAADVTVTGALHKTQATSACGRTFALASASAPESWVKLHDNYRCLRCVSALPAEVEPSPDATAAILADVLARPGVSVMTEASVESPLSDALDVTAYAETPTGSVPLVTVTTEGRKRYLMRRHRFDERATPVHTFDLVTRLASSAVAADLAHTLAAELATEDAA